MEYRKLPHGDERLGVLGLGMGGIQNCPDDEIEQIIRTAIDNGINFFDLCAGGKNVYEPFGRTIVGQRERCFSNCTWVRSTMKKANTAGREICLRCAKPLNGR